MLLRAFIEIIKKDVLFLTGLDEHGQKVQQAAEKRGVEPKLPTVMKWRQGF